MSRLILCLLALTACEVCEPEPETYNGGRQIRWFVDAQGRECADYQTLWCEYTLCQERRLCGWELAGWYCW
jgi:hypothetical protein